MTKLEQRQSCHSKSYDNFDLFSIFKGNRCELLSSTMWSYEQFNLDPKGKVKSNIYNHLVLAPCLLLNIFYHQNESLHGVFSVLSDLTQRSRSSTTGEAMSSSVSAELWPPFCNSSWNAPTSNAVAKWRTH